MELGIATFGELKVWVRDEIKMVHDTDESDSKVGARGRGAGGLERALRRGGHGGRGSGRGMVEKWRLEKAGVVKWGEGCMVGENI